MAATAPRMTRSRARATGMSPLGALDVNAPRLTRSAAKAKQTPAQEASKPAKTPEDVGSENTTEASTPQQQPEVVASDAGAAPQSPPPVSTPVVEVRRALDMQMDASPSPAPAAKEASVSPAPPAERAGSERFEDARDASLDVRSPSFDAAKDAAPVECSPAYTEAKSYAPTAPSTPGVSEFSFGSPVAPSDSPASQLAGAPLQSPTASQGFGSPCATEQAMQEQCDTPISFSTPTPAPSPLRSACRGAAPSPAQSTLSMPSPIFGPLSPEPESACQKSPVTTPPRLASVAVIPNKSPFDGKSLNQLRREIAAAAARKEAQTASHIRFGDNLTPTASPAPSPVTQMTAEEAAEEAAYDYEEEDEYDDENEVADDTDADVALCAAMAHLGVGGRTVLNGVPEPCGAHIRFGDDSGTPMASPASRQAVRRLAAEAEGKTVLNGVATPVGVHVRFTDANAVTPSGMHVREDSYGDE